MEERRALPVECVCMEVCACVYIFMSPGDRVCKVNNCRHENLFFSHREHIVPGNYFKSF